MAKEVIWQDLAIFVRVSTQDTTGRTLGSSQDEAQAVAEIILAKHRERHSYILSGMSTVTENQQSQSLSCSLHPTTSNGCPIPMHWNGYGRSFAK